MKNALIVFIALVSGLFLFLSCQKKTLPPADTTRAVSVATKASVGSVYSKKYHTNVYAFKNGCVVGLQQNDGQGELFYDGADETHTVLEIEPA